MKDSMKRSMGLYILWLTLPFFINGCSGAKPNGSTVGTERLGDCPDRPNCVSSEARENKHHIAPLRLLKGDPAMGWNVIRHVIGSLPRTTIIQSTDRYLHAECKSRLFGFVDDLELQLDTGTGVIAIRSASRVGYSDLGVNRRRVEALRHILKEKGVIQ
ncbi:MAG: DUF1499 domain-containing protein [Pseudomonadota bacterium]